MEQAPNILINNENSESKTPAAVDFLLAQCFLQARDETPEKVEIRRCRNGVEYDYLRGDSSVIDPELIGEESMHSTMVRLIKYKTSEADEDGKVRIGQIKLRTVEGEPTKFHVLHDTENGKYVIEREIKTRRVEDRLRWLGQYAAGKKRITLPANPIEVEILYNSLKAFKPYS